MRSAISGVGVPGSLGLVFCHGNPHFVVRRQLRVGGSALLDRGEVKDQFIGSVRELDIAFIRAVEQTASLLNRGRNGHAWP